MVGRSDMITEEIKELRLKETYLEVINSFATVLFDTQSIDEIVFSIANHAIAKLNYWDCVIYLYNEEDGRLYQEAAYGPKSAGSGRIKNAISVKPGEGIVGSVFLSGVGEIVNDTSKDERYMVDDEIRLSEISIPLLYKGNKIGVIDSEHPEKDFFNEQDFKMLTTLAAMVSSKIVQVRATQELKSYQQNLETLISEKTKQLEKAMSDLERTNKDLKQKNYEKEVLLKEIHHRVKNNMQIMISLLNIQANSSSTIREQEVLKDFRNRIRSMALIHDRIYLEKDVSNISIDEYINELVMGLRDSFQPNKTVMLDFEMDPIAISIETAIPIGLMMNEMVTNSLKHAFEDVQEGLIRIQVTSEGDDCIIYFMDNGKGFNFEKFKGASFGLELLEILSSQINGSVNYSDEDGCSYTVRFPMGKL
ncbi:MAG: GAF domain-containing protein [Flavobacteriales bacterium]|nr:GAF domain-containing protein [Flavobacteriales bacterium]